MTEERILMLRTTVMRCLIAVLLLLALARGLSIAQPSAASPAIGCGEVMRVDTHDRTTTRYTVARGAPAQEARIALVLLVGGGGNINLDDQGCPRSLSRNVLMRMLPLFHGAGFVTALSMRRPILSTVTAWRNSGSRRNMRRIWQS